MAAARMKGGAGARRKLAAFLKDFDREVKSRLERLRANEQRLLKEMENLNEIEILRLPLTPRS